jgi:hypothetical protein
VAIWAFRFLAAVDQGLKLVMTLFADVFKNRHRYRSGGVFRLISKQSAA